MLRSLLLKDKEQFLQLLNTFRPVNINMINEEFQHLCFGVKKTTMVFVYVLEEKIVGTISVIYERKFINNGALYAHIEDVVVLPEYRGKRICTKMINEIIKMCKSDNVYKIILNCVAELEPMYAKYGFNNNGSQMIIKT